MKKMSDSGTDGKIQVPCRPMIPKKERKMETTLKSTAYGDFLVEYVKGPKSKLRQFVHCKVVIKAIIKIKVVYEIQTK